jgi:hypothetical protein
VAFQIKDFASICASQINHARSVTNKITDFLPGSVARTLMEAPAVEIEELYLQMFLGLREAIPVATFLSFGFDRLPPAHAHGWVSVSKSPSPTAPISIPLGTQFSTADGRSYSSTAAVTWAANQATVRVPVAADVAGLAGNVAAGVINASPLFPGSSGFTVGNALIETGRDLETDTEREARFADFVRALSRGTVTACLFAARSSTVLDEDGNIYEYVTRAGIREDAGWVRIYVYSSRGVPSGELLADGQLRMDGTRDDQAGTITPGFRSAGVRVDVLAMEERTVPFAITVGMLPGSSLTPAVTQDLEDVFSTAIAGIQPGQTLQVGTLVQMLLGVTGVRTVVPVTNSNITCDVDEALVPGVLTITAL